MSRLNRNIRYTGTPAKSFGLTILAAALVMLAAACANSVQEPGQGIPTPNDTTRQKILSPVEIPYLVKNPLKIETIASDKDTEYYKNTLSISGLVDADIEREISEELASAGERMSAADVPRYRGIKRKLTSDAVLSNNTIEQILSWNYNNILSVIIYNNRTYMLPDSSGNIPESGDGRFVDTLYVGAAESYNYDLNTGKQIALKDVFADDIDYLALLNDYIAKKLNSMNADDEGFYGVVEMYGLKMAAPFTGISEDQQFFLFQGGLGLIFDQDDPQFDVGMYPQMLYIYFSDLGPNIAVTKRFYDEKADLYTSQSAPIKEFLQEGAGDEISEQHNEKIGSVSVYYIKRYPKAIPASAQAKAEEAAALDMNRVREIEILAGQNGGEDGTLEQIVWANKAGPFTTVVKTSTSYYSGQWYSSNENYCFDSDGRQLILEDLFVPGYDYETEIRKALQKAMDGMEQKPDASSEELYNSMTFGIGLSEINFMTKPIRFDEFSSYPVNFILTFESIGCENLTLFD